LGILLRFIAFPFAFTSTFAFTFTFTFAVIRPSFSTGPGTLYIVEQFTA